MFVVQDESARRAGLAAYRHCTRYRSWRVAWIILGLFILMIAGAEPVHAGPTDPPVFVTSWGGNGTADGDLRSPSDVEVDANGDVYVVDSANDRIQKFSPDGVFLEKWGSAGSGPGQFNRPFGIGIGPDGFIYVLDQLDYSVKKFDAGGTFITEWGEQGIDPGELNAPSGIDVGPDGRVFVADQINYGLHVFSSDGAFIDEWEFAVSGSVDVAVDADGYVYVVGINDQVMKFSPDGALVLTWGGTGNGDGQFLVATGIAVSPAGYVYVSDTYSQLFRVQKFDTNGNFLTKWGNSGDDAGQLNSPRGVAADAAGNIYLTNYPYYIKKFAEVGPVDSDGDGIEDAADNCPNAANPEQTDTDGDGAGDACDDNDDNDAAADDADNCSLVPNDDQADLDGDGLGDACDNDDDGDTVVDDADNCPADANTDHADQDADGTGDACDTDDDGDTVADDFDNCPLDANPDQPDLDADGIGDVCDTNDDNDGVDDEADNCPVMANPDQTDLDEDGIGDVCDEDADGDGVSNSVDNCPVVPNPDQANADGDSAGDMCDVDDDNDTIADDVDTCPLTPNLDQVDSDGDGTGDACDDDDDGDGVNDDADNCPLDANPDQADFDGDGIGTACDPDEAGPTATNVHAEPNPVPINTLLALMAIVDDTASGGSTIVSAEYSRNDGSWIPMDAADEDFDELSEVVTVDLESFSEAGVHTLCVRGTDSTGNTGVPACTLLAIYDPTAGFVTGSGWIDSPAGAFAADPSLAGRARFGFIARYKKGTTTPEGRTQFQFQTGDLNFRSSDYQWLVVAGPNAKFKGTGTINGSGDYGFMLTAVDGEVNGGEADKFRIKIWDLNNGDAVVYDNQMGADDDSYDGTTLDGGSIMIRSQGGNGKSSVQSSAEAERHPVFLPIVTQ